MLVENTAASTKLVQLFASEHLESERYRITSCIQAGSPIPCNTNTWRGAHAGPGSRACIGGNGLALSDLGAESWGVGVRI